jgi:phage shock protein PspC (stress-responsive transcriptional regulator)
VGKRLFRNPEERVLGGVSGGLAAYFNKEVWIFRLIFAAPLVLNILFGILNGAFFAFQRDIFPNFFLGSFTGTFILIYIVLWIVLPEARSPFERMEMRGETVDVNRIRQNVQEGMSDFKTRAQAWGGEVRDSAQQFGTRAAEFANTRGRTFATEVSQSGRTVGRSVGHVIGMLFKIFFLFVFGFLAFILFVLVVVFALGGLAQPVNNFLLDGFWQKAFLWGTLLFFLAVPLIAIITWIVRRLMKVRSQNRYLGWTFGGLWTLGWICLILFIAMLTKDFRTYDRISQDVPLTQPALNKLTVRVDEPGIRYSGTYAWLNEERDDNGWDLTEDSLRWSDIKLRVQKSADPLYHVTVWKYSRGSNRNEARSRAQKLIYTVTTADSALVLGSGMGIGKADKFRAQRVIVEIRVPVGKQISFDQSIAQKLDFTSIRTSENRNWDRRDWDNDWNGDNFYDWQPNVVYTMTENGELVDLSKPLVPQKSDVYEYNEDANRSLDSQIQRLQREREERIQKQRQRVEEENRKLEELQNSTDNATESSQNTGGVLPKKHTPMIEQTGIHTPVFSLLI